MHHGPIFLHNFQITIINYVILFKLHFHVNAKLMYTNNKLIIICTTLQVIICPGTSLTPFNSKNKKMILVYLSKFSFTQKYHRNLKPLYPQLNSPIYYPSPLSRVANLTIHINQKLYNFNKLLYI